jgi:hypothetical protein
VAGLLSEGNSGSKFNASEFSISVPFGALVELSAKRRLMALQKQFSKAQFFMYRYNLHFKNILYD